MRTRSVPLFGTIAVCMLAFAWAIAASAQTTININERNFEILAVDGNRLVVRDERGTNQLTVPDDFRFVIDGKKMSVSELKAGMKGTATVTTTTTLKPVVITEVRDVEVLRASDLSVTVRDAAGDSRRYSQGELDSRGIQIVKDGKPIRVADLRRGDKLTASIITAGPPIVLTAKEVEATLAEAKSDPAPMQVAAAPAAAQSPAPSSSPTPAATSQPAPSMQPAPTTPATSPPATRPAESSGMSMTWYVLIAVLVAIALFIFARRKRAP